MFDEPHFIAKMAAITHRFEEVGNLIVQPEVIGKRTESPFPAAAPRVRKRRIQHTAYFSENEVKRA